VAKPAEAGAIRNSVEREDAEETFGFDRSQVQTSRQCLDSVGASTPSVSIHPCRCLWRGLVQITKIFPSRRTILQLSQIRLTLERTFIGLTAFVPDWATPANPGPTKEREARRAIWTNTPGLDR